SRNKGSLESVLCWGLPEPQECCDMVSPKRVAAIIGAAVLNVSICGCGPSKADFKEAKDKFQTLAIAKEKKIKAYVEARGSELLDCRVVEVGAENDSTWSGVYPYRAQLSFEYYQTKGKDPLRMLPKYRYRLSERKWVFMSMPVEGEEVFFVEAIVMHNYD